jgi:hypothetical protein
MRTRSRSYVVGALLVVHASLQLAARTHAEPAIELLWPDDAACSRPAHAEAEIVRLLGPGAIHSAKFSVEVHALDDGRRELSLRFASAPPESARRLQLGSCEEVHEAVVLLAAMAIDPSLSPPPSAPAPAPEPPATVRPKPASSRPAAPPASDAPESDEASTLPAPAEPPASPAAEAAEPALPPEREEPVPVQAAPPRLPLAWELAVVADFLSLPGVSGGPDLALALDHPRLQLALHGRYVLPRRTESGLPAGGAARIDLLAAALELGARFGLGRLELGPVAELEVGALRGRASDVPGAANAGNVWCSLWAGGLLRLPLHPRMDLTARALLGVPLTRPRFALRGDDAFHTTAPVGVRIFLGASFALSPTD